MTTWLNSIPKIIYTTIWASLSRLNTLYEGRLVDGIDDTTHIDRNHVIDMINNIFLCGLIMFNFYIL